MDRNTYAIVFDILRCGLALFFMYEQQDWFGTNDYSGSIKYFLAAYFIVSFLINCWFARSHSKEDHALAINA
jgi:hypothetical protein